MKKILFLLISLMVVAGLALTACGGATQPQAPAQPAQEEQAQPAQPEEPKEEVKEEAKEEVKEEAPAPAAAGFDWRKYEGTKIRVAMVSQPWSQFLESEDYLAQFEELTGIDVTYEILPEDQFRQKTTIEFAAGTSDVDVFLSMVAQEGIKYENAGWYTDFSELINNADITDPAFDFADFSKSSLSIATLPTGKLIGLPVYNEFGALFFNKALFDKAGVAYPPQTLEEMEAAAKAMHDPDNGVYGVCLRGKGAAATSQFSSFMHSFGTDWVDAGGNANILDPKFVEAVNWYGMMDREYGPPGATSYHWQQCQDLFLQGKVAMWKDASVFFANLIDPEQSQVVDTASVAIVPAGPAGQTPYVGGWHLSIYNGSKNKEAAWQFVQWALGKEMTLKAQLKNITTGRKSAWGSAEYTAANKHPELAENFLKAMEIGDPRWNPPVLSVGEARDAVGAAIVMAIEGGDVDAALADANEVVTKLLADTPKLGPAAAAPAAEPAPAMADFDWRKYEGTKIRVAMVSQPWSQFLESEDYLAQFEELTGIDVTYEILPEDQFRQKTTIEFAAGTSDVDVFLSMVAQEGIKYENAGWYTDFSELINNADITDPAFDFADFSKSSLSIATLPTGKLIGLPVYNEFGALFFNKALFDKAGVAYPPQTLEEMEAAAKAMHDPDNGVYGVCLRGKGAAATSQFSSFMHSFGTDWVDAGGNANILDPKFVEAVNWYGMMDREYGPPGATSYHWQQCQDLFLQGKVAMWKDASVFFANLIDPEQSQVVDTASVAIVPAGPAGQTPYVGGWHLSIYNGSKNKEAAWQFVQWALGKEMTLKAQLKNITTGRKSAWGSAEYTAANKHPELAENFLKAMEIGDPRWNPPVLSVGEARDAVGAAIVMAIEGGDVDAALADANEVVTKLLADTPKLQ
jgi:multiple sugar transport system substrate-binding protein